MKGLCKRAGVSRLGFMLFAGTWHRFWTDTHKVGAKTIQRILGPKNVMTTERYIQKINHDLEATLNLLSEKNAQEERPKVSKEG